MSKKVSILCFVSSSDNDKELLNTAKTTYAKNILDGNIDGFEFYGVQSMTDDEISNAHHKSVGTYNSDEHIVYVPATISNSYKMFECALKTLHEHLQTVDYLLIVQPSTYLNIPMLYTFVNSLDVNDETIYCSRILNSTMYSGPYDYCVFADCMAAMFPLRFYYDIMLKKYYRNLADKLDKNKSSYLRTTVLDYALGRLIDSALINQQKEHTSYYRNWNHINFYDMNGIYEYDKYMSVDFSGAKADAVNDMIKNYNKGVESLSGVNQTMILSDFFTDQDKHTVYCMDNYTTIKYSEYIAIIQSSLKKNSSDSSYNNLDVSGDYSTYWKWFNIYSYYPYWVNSQHGMTLVNGSSFTEEDLVNMQDKINELSRKVAVIGQIKPPMWSIKYC